MAALHCLALGLILLAHALGSPIIEEERAQAEDDSILSAIYKINRDSDVNFFEGDINTEEVGVERDEGHLAREKRNAARDRKKLWPGRTIAYEYDPALPSAYHSTIQDAIAEYHKHTCLRFTKRTTEQQWIVFVRKDGCWSAVGRQYWLHNFGQEISLGAGCNNKGTVIHEMMHAIGFWHEQSRPDRNQYVEVLWENIIDGEGYNFEKYSHGQIDRLQIPYDFESIMHYGKSSFSKNGKPTIQAVKNASRSLGQRKGFTSMDIREINALYDCGNKDSPWSAWSDFGPCSLNCEKVRQRFCTSSAQVSECPEADRYGVQTEIHKCSEKECKAAVDGNWGRWSSWGECSATCGNGTHVRSRRCDDPAPRNGGKFCEGPGQDTKRCNAKSCGIGPDDCEFDHDKFCHWTNDVANKQYTWTRHTGTTPSSKTGPSQDHSSGSGHYLYAESSSPADVGQRARLVSRAFPATPRRCVSFWYHMYGSGIGQLNVQIQTAGAGARHTVWSLSGEQGDAWKEAKVTIASEEEYKVLIEAVRGDDFRGDIALDDVRFTGGPCLEPIGCYKDRRMFRALSILLKNYRGSVDWHKIDNTIAACATKAMEAGHQLFGVQYYGECWVGTDADRFDKYGPAPPGGCWEGVGKQWTNFVYKIV